MVASGSTLVATPWAVTRTEVWSGAKAMEVTGRPSRNGYSVFNRVTYRH